MPKTDDVRLRHMLDAAKEAQSFMKGKNRGDLDANRMLVLSVLRLVEVIGEAASQVSKECQEKYPEIPWGLIVAMRNRLVHAYFDVDLDRVWSTMQDDLPPLIAQLEKIIPEAGSCC